MVLLLQDQILDLNQALILALDQLQTQDLNQAPNPTLGHNQSLGHLPSSLNTVLPLDPLVPL